MYRNLIKKIPVRYVQKYIDEKGVKANDIIVDCEVQFNQQDAFAISQMKPTGY